MVRKIRKETLESENGGNHRENKDTIKGTNFYILCFTVLYGAEFQSSSGKSYCLSDKQNLYYNHFFKTE